ncbi:rhomboid family intramembrane serine protease [Rhizobium skierniewicense]|uniref:rhomboid family intramembrane serine protease n=1 Tax=Rhizobium skierniewicense TaxID=984260 RepID=UPI0015741963|nr:rhomboid family intramembrane serine protease [Rhizobium skierniewicense]NTF34143.1 rhomboid family intramembrane serine protease [Rhizobium skierniewicense]
MFIPLHDANSLKHIKLQYVTVSLIAVNILVWLLVGVLFIGAAGDAAILGLGFIPAVVFDYAQLDPALQFIPDQMTVFSYAFMHLGFWHLASNMLFLWVFGDNVEDAFGHLRFLLFYLACAAAGALFHGVVAPSSQGPLIGASGAVSGVVAAYLLLHPKVRVWILVFMRIPIPLPAFIPLALWIGQQFFMFLFGMQDRVSWGAHVGGIIAGVALVLVLRRPGVPLFDRTIVTPRAVQYKNQGPQAAVSQTERPFESIR